ncbi:hypothetical protein [Vibrio sp. 1CM8B]|uniref:hypothetical protein n=1 Tax=Vibrio sp. 1CM8B TaxID=2929167 RepID=UPI0020C0301A|nr:hypothetical protein [Vibrio sp. 1CM8B]MCK8087075.1 hypothetical protein [Vibrio sp. 1CM8B]
MSKYVCDASFCRSQGTLLYARKFITHFFFDINILVNRKKDIEASIDTKGHKVFRNYIGVIFYALFHPKIKWISINNIPIASFNKNNILLLHNIFYTYSFHELISNKSCISVSFFFKWFYFRTVLMIFPPSAVYVQTKFMKKRLSRFCSSLIKLAPNFYNDIPTTNNAQFNINLDLSYIDDYIFFLGGREPHKMVVDTLNGFLKSNLKHNYRILVVGCFTISDFVRNERVKIMIKSNTSHIEYLKLIHNSSLCVVTSKHESLCMPLLECASMRKKCFVASAEYSLELAKKSDVFDSHRDLVDKVEAYYNE